MKNVAMNCFLQSVVILAATTAVSAAAVPGPACAPILAAMVKTLKVDHATQTLLDGKTNNGITAGGVNYLQIDNAWKVSPLSPQDNQTRSEENLRNAKSYVCQPLPDSSIDGVTVANYRTRTETEDAVVESRISISKASGLAVQVENDHSIGGGKTSRYITRYTYTGIHAPSTQK